jgi:hypothetical protein
MKLGRNVGFDFLLLRIFSIFLCVHCNFTLAFDFCSLKVQKFQVLSTFLVYFEIHFNTVILIFSLWFRSTLGRYPLSLRYYKKGVI